MEAATSTNTGTKRNESLVALAIRGAKRVLAFIGLLQNRAAATTISGTVVAGGGVLVFATITPQYTGKFRVSWSASWAAPGAVTVTPFLGAGHSVIASVAAFAQTGNVVGELAGVCEFDGFAVGTSLTWQLQTTAGDGSITLGQGAAVAGASILIEELP